jgi:hypothetical protein
MIGAHDSGLRDECASLALATSIAPECAAAEMPEIDVALRHADVLKALREPRVKGSVKDP